MASSRLFTLFYTPANIEREVSYTEPTLVGNTTIPRQISTTDRAIDPQLPVEPDLAFGAPDGGWPYADGEVVTPEFCEGTAGVTILASHTSPFATISEDPTAPACSLDEPANCDLTATAVWDSVAELVTVTASTTHGSVRYSLTPNAPAAGGVQGGAAPTYPIEFPTSGMPAGPQAIFAHDAGIGGVPCRATASFTITRATPPDEGPTSYFDLFSTNGVEVRLYYVKDTQGRRVRVELIPASGNVTTTVTEQERGRAEGDFILAFCEGTTRISLLASLDAPFATIALEANSAACGYTAPISLQLAAVGVAGANGQQGSIAATATGGAAPLTLELLGTGRSFSAVSGQSVSITSLAPGIYQVRVLDNSGQTRTVSVIVPAAAVSGCTDPAATNYNSSATEDDGSCTYAPVTVAPLLYFPEPQSLRFVPVATSVDSVRPDNTFLSTQQRPGLFLQGYCQKIAHRDDVLVQWRSNFAAHTVQVIHCTANQAAITFAPTRIVKGKGNKAVLKAYLTAHTVTGKARLYFDAAVLPLPFALGNRIVLSGTANALLEGNYPIQEIREDSNQGVPYLVLGINYAAATAALRVDCTATTTYDVASFDVWQVALKIESLPAGCYHVRIRATDPALGTVRIESEPFELAPEHPHTVLVSYRNFDNAYGLNYSFGLVNKLRVVGRLEEEDPATTASILVESDTTTTLLAATARRRMLLRTFQLPPYLHEKLALACKHDLLLVQGMEYVVEEAYESARVANYSLKNGQATLTQRQWLGAGNGDDFGDLTATEQGFLLADTGNLQY